MQILPAAPQASTSALSAEMLETTFSNAAGNFVASFQDAMTMVQAAMQDTAQEQDLAAQAAEESEEEKENRRRASNASPYTRSTSDGTTYTLQEVCFTKQDLQQLIKDLLQAGAPANTLKSLNELSERADGANLDQVMASLKGRKNAAQASDEDENSITGLLNSIDPSSTLSISVMQAIGENDPALALKRITETLRELSPDEQIEVSKQGMLALGRGLGLGEDTLQKISAMFGESEHATIFAGRYGDLLSPISEQILAGKSDQQKLQAALDKTLTPILNKAKQRTEKEKAASELQNLKAEQSKVMIDRTVRENSLNILNQTVNQEKDAARASNQPSAFEGAPDGQLGDGMMDGSAMTADGPAFRQDASLRQNANGGERQNEWSELFSKVRLQKTGPAMSHAQQAAFAVPQGLQADNSALSRNAARNTALPHQAAQQVQSAMFTAMNNGVSRIDLQLHPQELGAITVRLVSRNGEVNAQIKADNAETVELLNQQADMIRENLEQQGIKIEKVEVQLNQQDDQANSDYRQWQDADHHNSYQEEDARRSELARIRNLATIRNQRTNSSSDGMEQPVQYNGHTAGNSRRSLDMVA